MIFQNYLKGVFYGNSGALINITPPANIISIVAAFYTSLYNPNFAQDESSGYLMGYRINCIKIFGRNGRLECFKGSWNLYFWW